MGIAGNLIAAGLGWYVKGPNTGLIIAGAGAVLWVLMYMFGRKADEHQQSPPIHVENKPETHIENKPVFENRPVFENKPMFIVSTGAAPAPAPRPDSRPKLTFDRWDIKGETLDIFEGGFLISNHGETALDIQVRRFKVHEGQFASSSSVSNIPAHHREVIAPVWLEGDHPLGLGKWDLLRGMKAAFVAQSPSVEERGDYVVTVSARFKDFDENIYEITAPLRYVHAQSRLVFGATTQRKIDPYNEVLSFLKTNSKTGSTSETGSASMFFVEHIASAIGIGEEQVAAALKRLYDDAQVFRSGIEGRGRDGSETKWGYVYWYAHL